MAGDLIESNADEKNKGGRPRKYQSVEQFDAAVQAYLDHCSNPDNNEPITWTGLCLFMGFYGRAELDNYLEYDGFSNSVKKAKSLVEFAYEKRLVQSDKPAGPIFALKNFGWRDKTEVDLANPDGSLRPATLDTSKLSTATLKELMAARGTDSE